MNKIGMKYVCGTCGQMTLRYFPVYEWFPTYTMCSFCSKDAEVIREQKEKVRINDTYYLSRISRSS